MRIRIQMLLLVSIVLLVVIMAPVAVQSQQTGDSGSTYQALLKRLKNNDMTIDFKVLRLSYTKTDDYKPYGINGAKDAAFAALNRKDFAGALKSAQTVLDTNYVDPDIHLLCRIAYREMGNAEKEAFHTSVLKGLVNSIYESGDGNSPEKAMVVINVAEEYFILNANGFRRVKQSSITVNGHDYDRMDVESKKTGEKKTFYFNVDIPRRWLEKSLKAKD